MLNFVFMTTVFLFANKQNVRIKQDSDLDSHSDKELHLNNDNCPRYLVIMTSTSEKSSHSMLSPFAVQKVF